MDIYNARYRRSERKRTVYTKKSAQYIKTHRKHSIAYSRWYWLSALACRLLSECAGRVVTWQGGRGRLWSTVCPVRRPAATTAAAAGASSERRLRGRHNSCIAIHCCRQRAIQPHGTTLPVSATISGHLCYTIISQIKLVKSLFCLPYFRPHRDVDYYDQCSCSVMCL